MQLHLENRDSSFQSIMHSFSTIMVHHASTTFWLKSKNITLIVTFRISSEIKEILVHIPTNRAQFPYWFCLTSKWLLLHWNCYLFKIIYAYLNDYKDLQLQTSEPTILI